MIDSEQPRPAAASRLADAISVLRRARRDRGLVQAVLQRPRAPASTD